MRYLKHTLNKKLHFSSNDSCRELIGYSDADWAGIIDDLKSCTGYTFILSGGAITWRSTKQEVVALSSTEAEYIALTATIQEGMWLMQLSNELNIGI